MDAPVEDEACGACSCSERRPGARRGFRDEGERDAVLDAVPKASDVPSEIVGDDLDAEALERLVAGASSAPWRWAELESRAAAEAGPQ